MDKDKWKRGSSQPPRERILAAARELVHRRGIHAVGADAIAAAAGTNKMTLYRHFASKDVLIAACLRELQQDFDVAWDASAAAHVGDPKGQLLAGLRHVCDFKANEARRGCGLANAAVELPDPDHPARHVTREYKTDIRERLIRLCRDARLVDPERVADEVFLICEGARVTAQIVGTEGLSARLSGMLEALVSEHARRGKERNWTADQTQPSVERAARSVEQAFDIPDRRLIFTLHRGRDFCRETITVIKNASRSGDLVLQSHVMPPGPLPRFLY